MEFPALHGAIADGGLADFLAAAEASAAYGQLEIVTRTGRVVLNVISGRLAVEGANDEVTFESGVARLRSELDTLIALPTGAYRCGPLLHHAAADGRRTVAVSDVLPQLDDRHLDAPEPPPNRVETPAPSVGITTQPIMQPAAASRPPAVQAVQARAVHAPPPPLPPEELVAAPQAAHAQSEPFESPDVRPVRASTLRRLLRTPSGEESPDHADKTLIDSDPGATRANALRSLIRGLATKD